MTHDGKYGTKQRENRPEEHDASWTRPENASSRLCYTNYWRPSSRTL